MSQVRFFSFVFSNTYHSLMIFKIKVSKFPKALSFIIKSRTRPFSVKMLLSDTAPLGSVIRPFMYILLFMDQKPVYQTTILGDYVFIEIPVLEVSAAEPRALEMKETATIMAHLRIPKMPLKQVLLNVYIPKNESTGYGADDFYSKIFYKYNKQLHTSTRTI